MERERLRLYVEEANDYLDELQRLFETTEPSEINIKQSRVILEKLHKYYWYYIQIFKGKEFSNTKGQKAE